MDLVKLDNSIFENIKHIDEFGKEYWFARELMPLLEYSKWENFHKIIKQAIFACENSNIKVFEHFPGVRKLSKRNNNAKVLIQDYKLSRYERTQ